MVEELLKVPEVARLLRISRSAAYGLVEKGKLPAVRLGHRCVRVRPSDLAEFIARHTQGGEP